MKTKEKAETGNLKPEYKGSGPKGRNNSTQVSNLKSHPSLRTAADALARWKSEVERREVNEALDRGATWREVATIAARHGHKGVNAQNVTNYRRSPDRAAWQAHRERLATIRQQSDITAAVMRHYSERGGSPAEAGLLAAAETLTQALAGVAPETLQTMVAADPKKFLTAVESLSKVATFIQRERTTAKAEAVIEDILSPEDRQRRLRAIFGLPNEP